MNKNKKPFSTRKKYETPRIVLEETFERTAAQACPSPPGKETAGFPRFCTAINT